MHSLENLFVTPNIGYIKEIYPYLKTVEESQKDGWVSKNWWVSEFCCQNLK